MSTYADRLYLAMTTRGLSPNHDQSELARRVGMGCKPQSIQHLLDPNKNAKSSKYSARIAQVLDVDVQWLTYGTGPGPDGFDVEGRDSDGAVIVVESKHRRPDDSQGAPHQLLEATQRQIAQSILAKLSGSSLTKALAYLQELDTRPLDERPNDQREPVVVAGGKAELKDVSRKRHSHG
ncbi:MULTISPECIES: helix-turn-helix domain-containing protein [Cupriavidus]|jgi:hypothetical protein|uniref:helix-turn-helix domain-containing protein n=1 Tax=Cupriavidus TaxID=106589 RepID=UPI00113FC4FD|nr:helix-turn-helix transcriptional regulator [Cupriavidus metallidurans]MDE4918183.1 helix-turn-helix transcriptional regulator [Cupriavidus metallidurans]